MNGPHRLTNNKKTHPSRWSVEICINRIAKSTLLNHTASLHLLKGLARTNLRDRNNNNYYYFDTPNRKGAGRGDTHHHHHDVAKRIIWQFCVYVWFERRRKYVTFNDINIIRNTVVRPKMILSNPDVFDYSMKVYIITFTYSYSTHMITHIMCDR